jgi:hypothetical protein
MNMEEEEMITVTREHYDELYEAYLWAEALDQSGVDNWVGYDDARDVLRESLKESKKDLTDD